MRHEAAVSLIGDLLHGRLSGGTRDELLSHVTSCNECRSLSETYATLSDAWNDDALEHPPSDLIVRYALDDKTLDEDVRDRIAAHLVACELCAAEIEVTSQAEADLAGATPSRQDRPAAAPDRGWLLAPALAAAAVLVVLAYPAYLGLFEVPRINDRLAALEAEGVLGEAPAWAGAVEMAVLRSPVRSTEDEVPTIELAAGQPYVPLAVDPGTLDEYARTEVVHIDIRDAAGRMTRSWRLDESELRRHVRRARVVTLLVPAADLPPGQLTLSVSRGPDRAEPVFDAPFLVKRSE
jgi:hypothetical protein